MSSCKSNVFSGILLLFSDRATTTKTKEICVDLQLPNTTVTSVGRWGGRDGRQKSSALCFIVDIFGSFSEVYFCGLAKRKQNVIPCCCSFVKHISLGLLRKFGV